MFVKGRRSHLLYGALIGLILGVIFFPVIFKMIKGMREDEGIEILATLVGIFIGFTWGIERRSYREGFYFALMGAFLGNVLALVLSALIGGIFSMEGIEGKISVSLWGATIGEIIWLLFYGFDKVRDIYGGR